MNRLATKREIALYDTEKGLLYSPALYSQIALHAEYGGGVVPESGFAVITSGASFRFWNRRSGKRSVVPGDVGAIAYTQGPGLAGALLVGSSVASSIGMALGKPLVGVHHLEGHLLSPLLAEEPPVLPFCRPARFSGGT